MQEVEYNERFNVSFTKNAIRKVDMILDQISVTGKLLNYIVKERKESIWCAGIFLNNEVDQFLFAFHSDRETSHISLIRVYKNEKPIGCIDLERDEEFVKLSLASIMEYL